MRRIYSITAIASFFVLVFCSSVFAADETITITTYYPSPSGSYKELKANRMAVGVGTTIPSLDGTLAWGEGVSYLSSDQGGAIELGGLKNGNPGTPFIDFHRDNSGIDYNARIILPADNKLEVTSDLTVDGRLNSSSCADYIYPAVSYCPDNTYAVACGSGSCAARGQIYPTDSCPQAGYMICVKN